MAWRYRRFAGSLPVRSLGLWAHPLLIPSYFVLLSVGALVFQAVLSSGLLKRLRTRDFTTTEDVGTEGNEPNANGGLISAVKDHVGKLGGSAIFFAQLARLVVVLTLLSLSIFSFLQDEEQDSIELEAGLGALGKHWGGKKRKHKKHRGSLLTEREWLDLAMSFTYVCPH